MMWGTVSSKNERLAACRFDGTTPPAPLPPLLTKTTTASELAGGPAKSQHPPLQDDVGDGFQQKREARGLSFRRHHPPRPPPPPSDENDDGERISGRTSQIAASPTAR